jgi:hypothetical protein
LIDDTWNINANGLMPYMNDNKDFVVVGVLGNQGNFFILLHIPSPLLLSSSPI